MHSDPNAPLAHPRRPRPIAHRRTRPYTPMRNPSPTRPPCATKPTLTPLQGPVASVPDGPSSR